HSTRPIWVRPRIDHILFPIITSLRLPYSKNQVFARRQASLGRLSHEGSVMVSCESPAVTRETAVTTSVPPFCKPLPQFAGAIHKPGKCFAPLLLPLPEGTSLDLPEYEMQEVRPCA